MRKLARPLATLGIVALAACGGGDDGTAPTIDAMPGSMIDAPPSPTIDATAGELTLTSGLLSEGGLFDPDQACHGANTSPDLAWSGAPIGTQSFAVIMVDTSFSDLGHWAIWDIDGSADGLPAAIENSAAPSAPVGAKQARSYDNVFGYQGPCPPATHLYRFTVYALDVAVLPGVTTASSIDEVAAAAASHALGAGTLSSYYPGD